jgi:integrase
VKNLKALHTLSVFTQVDAHWKIPEWITNGDPSPAAAPRSREEIQSWFAAMEPGSLERDVVKLKVRTGIRNEEIYNLQAKHVFIREAVLRFVLRNKKRPVLHEIPLSVDVVEMLAARVAELKPSDYVFTLKGRKLRESSLRKRFLRASERAEIHPPITSMGQLRHLAITAGVNAVGTRQTQVAVGHRTVTTTERYVKPSPEDEAIRREVWNAIAQAMPLD